MGNPFCWVELTTENLEQAKEFYSQIFAWSLSEFQGAKIPYFFVNTGGQTKGGMMALPAPEVPTAWTMYVLVEDVAATCQQIQDLGGRVLKAKSSVPDMGWYAVVADPQGAVFGLWEEK